MNTNILEKGLPPGKIHYYNPDVGVIKPKANRYKPKKGFEIHFDFISGVDKKYKEVRIIYGVY